MTDQNDDGSDDFAAPPPPADATTIVPQVPAAPPPPQPQAFPPQPPAPPDAPPAYGQPAPPAYGQPAPPTFAPHAYAQPVVATGTTSRRRSGGVIAGALTMLVGAAGAILGSILPWLSSDGGGFGDLPNGLETYAFFQSGSDGLIWTNPGAWIIGFYALVTLLAIIVLATGKATWNWVCGIIATLVAAAVAFVAVIGIADLASNFRGLDIGPGIALIVVGALIAFLGSLIGAIVG